MGRDRPALGDADALLPSGEDPLPRLGAVVVQHQRGRGGKRQQGELLFPQEVAAILEEHLL